MRPATRRAASRFRDCVDAARRVFERRGYRRTQISDVAREQGVSAGLVYHYFESKEALFHVALEDALSPEGVPVPDTLPVPTPDKGDTLAMVRAYTERWVAAPLLDEVLGGGRASEPHRELEALVLALYDGSMQRRHAADLLERSALEHPELAELWFGEVRKAHLERVSRYITQRMESGQLRRLPDPAVTARIVIEIVVFFARHRFRDPYEKLDDAAVRETVVRFVLAALVPGAG